MKIFFKYSLKTIFVLTSIITVLSLVITLAIIFTKIEQIINSDKIVESIRHAEKLSTKAQYHTIQIQQFMTDASLTGDHESVEEAKENHKMLNKTLDEINILTPSFSNSIEDIRSSGDLLAKVGEEMMNAYTKEGKSAGDAVMKRQETGFDERSEAITQKLDILANEINKMTEAKNKDFHEVIFKLKLFPILLSVWLILISFGTLLFILKKVKSLQEINDTLINKITQLSATTAEVFSISQELSQSAESQSASVHEAAASTDEIAAMARRSSEHAGASEAASQDSKTTAIRGQQIVKEVVDSVNQIENANLNIEKVVGESNSKFDEIISSINEIGSKTKIINDIVFQTKLLSFNASVEAARAGEHGKGFAVVAEEIAKLAQMSGDAAIEISQILNLNTQKVKNIIDESSKALKSGMSKSHLAIENGSKIVSECATVLNQIVEISNTVSESVASISSASKEQSLGVNEISIALRQIDQSTNQALAASKGTLSSSELLASRLKDLQIASSLLSEIIKGKRIYHHFEWTDSYQLNVPSMDDEHKVLIDKMNFLFDEIGTGSIKKIKVAFGDLASYAVKHFEDEENYFDSINYPKADAHKAIHRALVEKVTSIGEQIGKPEFEPDSLTIFLKEWLMFHILQVDKGYSPGAISTKDKLHQST